MEELHDMEQWSSRAVVRQPWQSRSHDHPHTPGGVKKLPSFIGGTLFKDWVWSKINDDNLPK
jgi:hypothetical protein